MHFLQNYLSLMSFSVKCNSEAELAPICYILSIDVVSKAFEGKSAVNRQRMVYKVIWEELQSTVHAVDEMTTKTPDEAAANK